MTRVSLSDILDEFVIDGPSAALLAKFAARWPEHEAELVDFYRAWIGSILIVRHGLAVGAKGRIC